MGYKIVHVVRAGVTLCGSSIPKIGTNGEYWLSEEQWPDFDKICEEQGPAKKCSECDKQMEEKQKCQKKKESDSHHNTE